MTADTVFSRTSPTAPKVPKVPKVPKAPTAPKAPTVRGKWTGGQIVLTAAGVVVSAIWTAPLLWAVFTSFKAGQ
nr:hypothetical protein OH820_09475 [Streptomyces sp. NBC_00857]